MSQNSKIQVHRVTTRPLFRGTSDASRPIYGASFKRGFDLSITIILAPFVLAIVGILALLVCLDGGGVFYCQPRLGMGGKTFKLWKLRTMVPDADERLQAYLDSNPDARKEWDSTQKLRDDPRITSVGKYLRKYSFDELPQLWNVFVGDMSLVGPRPMMPHQRQYYPGTAYFTMRPGITGLWQISERNDCTFAERAIHDNRYAAMISFSVDLWILSKTPAVVLQGTGV
ncbi:Undecaprenyl-phosphate galactosephosphotransferase (plasmid) [Sinorhizobium sojae CCBAU 05684]|uniref:Undecaprenyl-phosphate galactosephosphotransferase n=1 Tax=Sinorhizobium sojae CCBAU 05684 TaxID=716928 RepID=A0A249PJW5_9HYPH|nr:sugar transferase [Sinorhizobium sojae]ASY65974.1 Undecaprenyl-phosphate galactosephosphotransferase [Sinorhizobium sojae CCBAU 05684]